MYDIVAYGAMITDLGRASAYTRALETCIVPGAVVLEIGTGPGLFALAACRAGAARVYAVEQGDIIQLAREAAAANGFADRIQFVQAMSTAIELPERVDGIVSDLRGALPMFGKSLVSLIDARNRFLKANNGWIVAARDTLWAAIVSSPQLYGRFNDAWNGEHRYDLSAARAKSVNSWCRAQVSAEDLLVEPRCWAVVDYKELREPNVCGEVSWTIDRAAVAHGVSVWFDSETAHGVGFSNSPTAGEKHVYQQAMFPWPQATELLPGDQVKIQLRAAFVKDDYVWTWDTLVKNRSGDTKTTYRQSTLHGMPLSLTKLHKSAHSFVPRRSDDAQIDLRILELMSDSLTVGDIASRILSEYPSRFRDATAALTRVGELSVRYSQSP